MARVTRQMGMTVLAVTLALAGTAAAQQRPLVTEDPRTVGGGQVLVETGVDWMRAVSFPVSGLRGAWGIAAIMAPMS